MKKVKFETVKRRMFETLIHAALIRQREWQAAAQRCVEVKQRLGKLMAAYDIVKLDTPAGVATKYTHRSTRWAGAKLKKLLTPRQLKAVMTVTEHECLLVHPAPKKKRG